MPKADWVYSLANDARGIARTLAPGVETRIFVGDNVMLSVVRMAPNAVGQVHSHPNEQWGVLLEGSATRIQGGEEIAVDAGEFWHTPGGVPHGIRGFFNCQSICRGQRPARAVLAQADNDIEAAVLQIECVRAALAAVAENSDLLFLQARDIDVGV